MGFPINDRSMYGTCDYTVTGYISRQHVYGGGGGWKSASI